MCGEGAAESRKSTSAGATEDENFFELSCVKRAGKIIISGGTMY
jgi:hypothetical protein